MQFVLRNYLRILATILILGTGAYFGVDIDVTKALNVLTGATPAPVNAPDAGN